MRNGDTPLFRKPPYWIQYWYKANLQNSVLDFFDVAGILDLEYPDQAARQVDGLMVTRWG